jgi:microcystin-dependent protein
MLSGTTFSINIGIIYPIGSIYLSVNSANPGTWLPGTTWVAWGSGKVPVGIDTGQTEFNSVEKTGGEKTHTLSLGELPSHNHGSPRTTGSMSANSSGIMSNVAARDSTSTGNIQISGNGHADIDGTDRNYGNHYDVTINVQHTHSVILTSNGSNQAHNNL